MANNKAASPRRQSETLRLSGIALAPKDGGPVEMENFRVTQSGAVEKRWGYTPTLALPGKPRACYAGYVQGKTERCFLIGDEVYRLTPDRFPGYLSVGRIGTTDGDAAFVAYLGELYLLDGDGIYLVTGGAVERIEGYIPLYGDGWDPIERGAILEPENRMTRRVRIRYRNPAGERSFYFGRRVTSVDRVTADGREIPISDVTLLTGGYGCTAAALENALDVEMLVTVEGEGADTASSFRTAFSFGRASDTSLFCYGGDDGTVFAASRFVTDTARAASEEIGRTVGGGIYFPVTDALYRLPAPITAVCRHNDRVLLFTGEGTWGVECEGDRFAVVSVHPSVGCDKKNAAVLAMNTPITYFGGRLYRFKEKLSGRSECNAEVISDAVADIAAEMRDGEIVMAYYGALSEIWLAEAKNDIGRVIVYRPDREVFYTYTGIYLDRMMPASDDVTFALGETLYRLDVGTTRDCGTREIVARCRTGYLTFGDAGKRKRFLGFDGEASPNGGEITLRAHADCGEGAAFVLRGRERDGLPVYVTGRRSIGRFRYLYCTVVCPGEARQKILSLRLHARA